MTQEKTKEQLEKEHSEKMNQEAIERIKQEEEKDDSEALRSEREAYIFEDDAELRLRDGKSYRVPPLSLRNARTLMKKLRTINVDAIILNFFPSGNSEADQQKEDDLFDILKMAFVNYPEIDRDYIDEYMDLETAKTTVEILIGLNGLKK